MKSRNRQSAPATGARRRAKGSSTRNVRPPRRASPCARVPLCLLEAVRSGALIDVTEVGDRFAIEVAGRILARRKHREAALALVDAARESVSSGLAAALAPSGATAALRRTVVITPQKPEGEGAHYALIEASALVASHRGTDFRPDPMYPIGVQERVYHSDDAERMKVVRGAMQLRPEFLLARTPSPLDGPPLVTEPPSPLVLGGNGRTMMVQRAYLHHPESAAAYKSALAGQARDFGFTPAEVEQMTAPVLVRVIEGLSRSSPAVELTAAVRRFNEGLTQRMDPVSRAVSQAKALSPFAVSQLGSLLISGNGALTLRELMREQPSAIVGLLDGDNIITPQNRSEWVGSGGALTDYAKDQLEGMFLGLVLGTPERFKATAPGLLAKLERAVPALVAVRAKLPAEFDLIPAVNRALDGLNDARSRGLSLELYAAQSGLFSSAPVLDGPALALARLFDASGPRSVDEAFRRWLAAANHDPNQSTLFGEVPTPQGALAALTSPRTANPASSARVRCTRCGGSGRVSPWAGMISWCEACRGEGWVRAAPPEDARQLRLVNPTQPRSGRLTSVARDTRGLARDLVHKFGGGTFPREVRVTTAEGKNLILRFKGRELASLNFDGAEDEVLRDALAVDLSKASPLVSDGTSARPPTRRKASTKKVKAKKASRRRSRGAQYTDMTADAELVE
jgi:hypothetical protein